MCLLCHDFLATAQSNSTTRYSQFMEIFLFMLRSLSLHLCEGENSIKFILVSFLLDWKKPFLTTLLKVKFKPTALVKGKLFFFINVCLLQE